MTPPLPRNAWSSLPASATALAMPSSQSTASSGVASASPTAMADRTTSAARSRTGRRHDLAVVGKRPAGRSAVLEGLGDEH